MSNQPSITGEGLPSLNMSSMIDVSFLLLIFFLLSAFQRPIEADLSMTLSCNIHHQPISCIDPMVISILADGNIMTDGVILDTDIKRRDLPQLEGKLKQYKAAADLLSTNPYLLLNVSNDAQWQRHVDVLNSLVKVGIKNIGFATN